MPTVVDISGNQWEENPPRHQPKEPHWQAQDKNADLLKDALTGD